MADTDERYTPPEVLEPLRRVFGELWDPCPRDYKIDGLSANWRPHSRCFVNPPYSNMLAWARKAVTEADKMTFVAFLIPNDCSTAAFSILRRTAWGRWEIPFRVKFGTSDGRKVDVARSHIVFFLGGLP